MVIDASALETSFLNGLTTTQRVITPHPGEAARLLSSSTARVQSDRLQACQQLLDAFAATTVLKGSGTIIGALIGQGMSTGAAARSAVYLHALCAERWSRERDHCGLVASDIIEQIPRVMRQLREK